jgi:hypothetical protein
MASPSASPSSSSSSLLALTGAGLPPGPSSAVLIPRGQEKVLTGRMGEEQPRSYVIEGSEVAYSFRFAPERVRHDRIRCDSCACVPIAGPRYKCTTCADFDFCARCYALDADHHDPTHAFMRIVTPAPPGLDENAEDAGVPPGNNNSINSNINSSDTTGINSSTGNSSSHQLVRRPRLSDDPSSQLHTGVACDGCGASPIVGVRFKCLTCERAASEASDPASNATAGPSTSADAAASINLCASCHRSGTPAQHRAHAWLVCPRELVDPGVRPRGYALLRAPPDHWGFRLRITATYTRAYRDHVAHQDAHLIQDAAARSQSLFTREMDAQLVGYASDLAALGGGAPGWDELTAFDVCGDGVEAEACAQLCPLLAALEPRDIRFRFCILKRFSAAIGGTVKLIDTHSPGAPGTLGRLLWGLRGILGAGIKTRELRTVVEFTDTAQGAPVVKLDRRRAMGGGGSASAAAASASASASAPGSGARAGGASLPPPPPPPSSSSSAAPRAPASTRDSLFVQSLWQLRRVRASALRRTDQAFQVRLRGEGAEDAGGVWRETMTQLCDELQAPRFLGLFVQTPNGRLNHGEGRDLLIPRPSLKPSPRELLMYELVGRLLGIAMRTSNPFPMRFPSMVWKALVGSPITRSDLEEVDRMLAQTLRLIEDCEAHGIPRADFVDVLDHYFTVPSADGVTADVPVCPRGASRRVTFESRHEYVECVLAFRAAELAPQLAAMRRGLVSLVPQRVLPLFSWRELEHTIVGRADFDVRTLRAHTVYFGFDGVHDPTVEQFWKVLASFTADHRALFLTFVWGRDRLPSNLQDLQEFDNGFQIHLHQSSMPGATNPSGAAADPDDVLPVSHTCFFSLELPRYSSYERMREKILYAITNCRSIDIDFALNDADAESDGEGA